MKAYLYACGKLEEVNTRDRDFIEEVKRRVSECAGPVDVYYDYGMTDPVAWLWYYSTPDGWRWGDVAGVLILTTFHDVNEIIKETKRRGKWPESPPKEAPRIYLYHGNTLKEIPRDSYLLDDRAVVSVMTQTYAYLANRIFVDGGAAEMWSDGERVVAWVILHNEPRKAIEELKARGLWAEPGTPLKDLGIMEWHDDDDDNEVSWEEEGGEEDEWGEKEEDVYEWVELNEEEGWDE
mgnify:CR=1 FL=1